MTRRDWLKVTALGTATALTPSLVPSHLSAQGGRKGMAQFKQDLCWWCFARQGVDPKRLIQEAKAIGYAGFELVPREWWDAIKEALCAYTVPVKKTAASRKSWKCACILTSRACG